MRGAPEPPCDAGYVRGELRWARFGHSRRCSLSSGRGPGDRPHSTRSLGRGLLREDAESLQATAGLITRLHCGGLADARSPRTPPSLLSAFVYCETRMVYPFENS